MKKKILTAVALIAALVLSLFMAACGDDGVGAVKFKVTAKYNAEQGAVVVTNADGDQKTEFGAGASVVVKVTAGEGYEIDAFTVNGVDAELTNGVYGFVISANTLVEATFKQSGGENPPDGGDDDKTPEELFAEAYESVKTTFMAVGSYTYKEEGEAAVTNTLTTVFGTDAVNIIEMNEDGEVEYNDVYVNKDGKIAQPYHTLDNEIAYNYPTVDVPFADYDNPFKKLSATDFTATSTKNVFALTAEDDVVTAAATALTGWNESIASFTVTIADGKVTRINITTKPITIGGGSDEDEGEDEDAVSYTSVYVFTLSEWGTAEVDEDAMAPYKTTAAHTALKNALKTASEAKNYTLVVSEVGLSALDGDIEYNVYVTENAIYYDCEGYEEGYVQMGEGSSAVVYPFDYEPETELVTLRDASVFPTIASMRASFNGFAPEIFELDDDGAYVLREDCYTPDNVHSILINFGDGVDQIRLYAGYTLDVKFVLKDGALYQVELYYAVSDALIMRTITYVDWDDTTLPIGFDNCEHTSVLDYYVGTYTDGTVTAVIDNNGIVINDKEFKITGYDIQYDLFTGEWNGEEWYITKQGEKQLLVFYYGEDEDDDITYTLTSTAIDPVEIPEEFGGVWSVNDKTVVIAYDMVEYNGNKLTVLSYDEKDGSLYATDGELTYRMFAEEDKEGNPVLSVIVLVDGLSTAYYDMTKVENAVIVPRVFIGTFEKFDNYYYKNFKAVLGLTTVELEFGNDKPTVTIVSATRNGYWTLTLDVDGVEYFIMENSYSADKIDLGSIEDHFSVTLDRVQVEEPPVSEATIPEAFHGTFTGEDDGTEYTVTISANELTVKIGNAAAITITDYEYDDGAIDFEIDGVKYGVYCYEYDDGVDSLYIYSYGGLYTTLTRTGGDTPMPSVTIPEKFYGEYWSADESYGIEIDQDGITIVSDYLDGEVVIVEYDDLEGYFTVTIGGDEYTIMDASYTNPVTKIALMGGSISYLALNRTE